MVGNALSFESSYPRISFQVCASLSAFSLIRFTSLSHCLSVVDLRPSSSISTSFVAPLKGDWDISATQAKDGLAKCNQPGENPSKYSSMVAGIEPGPQGGQTVSSIHSPTELSWLTWIHIATYNKGGQPSINFMGEKPLIHHVFHVKQDNHILFYLGDIFYAGDLQWTSLGSPEPKEQGQRWSEGQGEAW